MEIKGNGQGKSNLKGCNRQLINSMQEISQKGQIIQRWIQSFFTNCFVQTMKNVNLKIFKKVKQRIKRTEKKLNVRVSCLKCECEGLLFVEFFFPASIKKTSFWCNFILNITLLIRSCLLSKIQLEVV